MEKYDYLIVGSGLFGATFAYRACLQGKKCLVIDKRPHLGGNIYCEKIEGINVHKYGAHIFHTSDEEVWNYVNQYARFNHYVNSPVAVYRDELYNLPFNMNTFSRMWNIKTPKEAKEIIAKQTGEFAGITGVGMMVFQSALNGMGADAIAAYTACSKLETFVGNNNKFAHSACLADTAAEAEHEARFYPSGHNHR